MGGCRLGSCYVDTHKPLHRCNAEWIAGSGAPGLELNRLKAPAERESSIIMTILV